MADDDTTDAALNVVPDDQVVAAVDRWLRYRLWATRTPGAQVAIGVGGRTVFSRGYGFADLERAVPMRPDHLFRIASHSKTFTATLVLQLVEQGRLGLEDRLGDHLGDRLSDPSGPLADVRLRELLEHTGGVLRDSRDADFWQYDRPFPAAEELITLAEDGGLKSEPGERFAYSNIGFSLLGLVIERVTGSSFAAAVTEMITAPLGLADTTGDYRPDRADDYAVGYTGLHTGDRRRALTHIDTGAMDAATGVTSTAGDLVGYFGAHALGSGRLLTDRSKRLQQRRLNVADPDHPDHNGYGLGLGVEKVSDGSAGGGTIGYVGHGGGYPGHITMTLLDPRNALVVSVLTNTAAGPAGELARGVLTLLAGARADDRAPDTAVAERLGLWGNDWGVSNLAWIGGRLRSLSVGPDPFAGADTLVAESDDRWQVTACDGHGPVGEPVVFGADDTLRYGGLTMRRWDVPEPSVARLRGEPADATGDRSPA